MAGYKTTALSLSPKLFITFDGDAFDDFSRTFTAIPQVILDESGRENHAILHDSGSTTGYPGYRAGMPSNVPLEQANQFSVGFGYYGRRNASPNLYEKAYLEVPHNAVDFAFPNDGKFTVMFCMRRENVDAYRAIYPSTSFTRPMVKKQGVFNVFMDYTHGFGARIGVTIPGGYTFYTKQFNDANFHNVDRHVALAWNTTRAGNGDISGTATLYLDGRIVATYSRDYYDGYPNTNVNSPILIGANLDPTVNHSDRNTENCQLDQIALYDTAFDANQVGRFFKKYVNYRTMILRGEPTHYWECNDIEYPSTNVLARTVGSVTASLMGTTGMYSRGVPGPSQVPGSSAVQFANGGQLYFNNSISPLFNINQDYSKEFWFSCTSTGIASLFSMNGDARPFTGLNITINMHNNAFSAGGIQVQESSLAWASASGSWADGREHHLAVVKRGTTLELWIDGTMVASKIVATNTAGYPSDGSMMSNPPGRAPTNGWISNIAWYAYALQPQQITARAQYLRVYKIRGRVTLRGVNYRANVRAYSHVDGSLVKEIFSNSASGEYLLELYDNRTIDLMVLNAQDPTVRYRVYGPITPSEYEDSSV